MDNSYDGILLALAQEAGIATHWRDVHEIDHLVSPDTLRSALASYGLPALSVAQIAESLHVLRNSTLRLPSLITATAGKSVLLPHRSGVFQLVCEDGTIVSGTTEAVTDGTSLLSPVSQIGYHRLAIGEAETVVAVAPASCFSLADAYAPEAVTSACPWGLAVQLYGLRRPGDGGIGDFKALEMFVRAAAREGAAAVAVSPVHALLSGDPSQFSPYTPSSRLMLNVLYADLAGVDGWIGSITSSRSINSAAQTGLEAKHLIDWPKAAQLRMENLRHAFSAFEASTADVFHAAFASFRRERGAALERHARFEALYTHFKTSDMAGWRNWPAAFQDAASSAVARFAEQHAREVSFHAFLQWLADRGLQSAQQAARAGGMKIGLISDLAVGTNPGGSHTWSRPNETLTGLTIGAPPDLLQPTGQDWGLAAFSPRGLRHNGFRAFIEMLRAALRHAGGVRIDHVMGLARLWVIPSGATAANGTYLAFPIDDLIRLVALESWRHRAIVLGEDLGTLPEGFHSRLEAAGLLGLRVMMFERDAAGFTPPRTWSENATAMTATHDLPTVAGWWSGRDISWSKRLGRMDATAARIARQERKQDRRLLWKAFQASGATDAPPPAARDGTTAADAAAAHIGASACALALLPVEDALGLAEQPNLPGVVTGHPNWRRRLPLSADNLLDNARVRRRLAALAAARSRR